MGAGGLIVVSFKSSEDLKTFKSLLGPLNHIFSHGWRTQDYEWKRTAKLPEYYALFKYGTDIDRDIEEVLLKPLFRNDLLYFDGTLDPYPVDWTFNDLALHLMTAPQNLSYYFNYFEISILKVCHLFYGDHIFSRHVRSHSESCQKCDVFMLNESMCNNLNELQHVNLYTWANDLKKCIHKYYTEQTWT